MMLLLLSYILLFIGSSLASLSAGLYQTVLLWYAYRLEVIQNNGMVFTAKGCAGTGAFGACIVSCQRA